MGWDGKDNDDDEEEVGGVLDADGRVEEAVGERRERHAVNTLARNGMLGRLPFSASRTSRDEASTP